MKANKYTFRVEWNAEAKVHVAHCLEFTSLKAHGKTPEAALKEIKSVVNETLTWMKKEGEEIPEPLSTRVFKGNLTLRIPPEVHRQLAIKSSEEGVSINQYILSKIA